MDADYHDPDGDNFRDESMPMDMEEGAAKAEVQLGEEEAERPLVGAPGQEFITSMLSTKDPQTAIGEVQAKAALPSRCKPLLQLLDQLGTTRSDSHRYVLEGARAVLLKRIASMRPDKLQQLLELSFSFIGIPELRAVPLAALNRLDPVPAAFLKQLANDRELFNELPGGVQRQVWELDKNLLQQHALPRLVDYIEEEATVSRALDMGLCIRSHYQKKQQQTESSGAPLGAAGRQAPPRAGKGGGPQPGSEKANHSQPGLPPVRLRQSSKALQDLVRMVGVSKLVYRGITDLCLVKFRDSDSPVVTVQEAALCTIRSQLLMALHDAKAVDLCRTEQCHKLAWTLDACLRDKLMDERRLRELSGFFQLYDGWGKNDGKRKKGGRSAPDHADGGDAESAGGLAHASNAEPGRLLGEAGLVLRDPATMHLLMYYVVQQLEEGTQGFKVPVGNKDLVFVTRLLQLALSARTQLQDRRYTFPDPTNSMLRTFYPLLSSLMADVQIAKLKGETRKLPTTTEAIVNTDLVEQLKEDELAMGISMVYALDRLIAEDTYTAVLLLASQAAALADATAKYLAEWIAYGHSLASHLLGMQKTKKLAVDSLLWTAAFEGVLSRLLDTHQKVQEQVLHLVVGASADLTDEALVGYAKKLAKESRKFRRRLKKAKGKIDVMGSADFGALGLVLPSGDISDCRQAPDINMEPYKQMAAKLEGRLNEQNCPDLFSLLRS